MGVGLRRLAHELRTEGSGRGPETMAVAMGVFIGCLPVYGLHLIICWGVGALLGLNRLKMYLAANISNPVAAPFLVFAELQAGSWIRRGTFHPVTLDAVRDTGVVTLGADLLVGSAVVGGVLAALAAWGTWATLHASSDDRQFEGLVRRAADRYVGTSIAAWEFARGKLRHDPVYRAAVYDGLLTPSAPQRTDDRAGWTLADVGCGQGLMLALLAEARRDLHAGEWASRPEPPCFDRMIGVETRPRVARLAQKALGEDAGILTADARAAALPRAHAVLLFDVLHLMTAADQEALLVAAARSLEPGGVIVVREADASAGWRFAAVRMGNWIKALTLGRWGQVFHFRSAAEWTACFARIGLRAEMRAMGQGTPFGNVLFRLTAAEVATRPDAGDDSVPMSPLAPAV